MDKKYICPKHRFCNYLCVHKYPHSFDDVECIKLKRHKYKSCPEKCIEVEMFKCPNTYCIHSCYHKQEHAHNSNCDSDDHWDDKIKNNCPKCQPILISDAIFTEKDFEINLSF